MQRIRTTLWGTLLAILLTTIIAFMTPVPATWPLTRLEFYLPFAANTIMACLHVGAAVLFVTNLDVYKAKLRRAYILISIAAIIIGLGTLQISIIAVLDAWRSPYVLGGGMMLPFLIAGFILYAGIRRLTLLVGTRHPLTHSWIALPLALLLAYLTSFLPHVAVTLEESAFDIGIAIIAWAAALMILSGVLVFTMRQQIGALYTRPLTWLMGAFFVSASALIIQCIYYLITTDYGHIITRINNIVVIGSGLMWLRAGYAFALTKYYQEDVPALRLLFGVSDPGTASQATTIIDAVTYAASLVSKSADIDPLLDNMRAVTARLQPGQMLSDKETAQLTRVYLEIETYLTAKEAIRNFSRREVRDQLDPTVRKFIADYEKHSTLA